MSDQENLVREADGVDPQDVENFLNARDIIRDLVHHFYTTGNRTMMDECTRELAFLCNIPIEKENIPAFAGEKFAHDIYHMNLAIERSLMSTMNREDKFNMDCSFCEDVLLAYGHYHGCDRADLVSIMGAILSKMVSAGIHPEEASPKNVQDLCDDLCARMVRDILRRHKERKEEEE